MKRWICGVTMLVMALGITANAVAQSVKYDADPDADFAKWNRFAWAGTRLTAPSLAEERLEKAIEQGFRDKGYAQVEHADSAHFVIAYRGAAYRELSVSEGMRSPVFGRDLRVNRTPTGTMVLEVYDAKTARLVWRGVVTDELAGNPEKADQKAARAVAKLLKKFPARAGVK